MPAFFIYLLKANIALAIFYLAYRFGLRRLTFYTLNRLFLLFGIAFSAVFPLINLNTLFLHHEQWAGTVTYYAPDWHSLKQYMQQQDPFTAWSLAQYIFWAGVLIMAIRLCMQMLSLFRIHRHTTRGMVNKEKVRLMQDKINPFSFFKNIYINPSLHTANELKEIIAHEKVHVRGWHTADIITGEINNIFYWFNPGAWLMKTAIRENLEFITDREILRSGIDAKAYQYSLIKVSNIPFAVPVANNFNFSHLKQRITMMNKKRSSGFHMLRYLLLLPVIAVVTMIVVSSRGQSTRAENRMQETLNLDTLKVLKTVPENQPFNESGYVIRVKESSGEGTVLSRSGVIFGPFNLFSFSKEQLKAFNQRFGSKATYEEVQAMKKHAHFLKEHRDIHSYFYESPNRILIWTNDHNSKIYHLNNATDHNMLLKKYGAIPPEWRRFDRGLKPPPPPKYIPPKIHTDTSNDPASVIYTPPGVIKDSVPYNNGTSGKYARQAYESAKRKEKVRFILPGDTIPSSHSVFNEDFSINFKGICVIDGKIKSAGALKTLKGKDIATINILKGEAAVEEYGDKGKKGVIQIYTKKYEKTHPKQLQKETTEYEKQHKAKDTSITFSANKVIVKDKEEVAVYAKPVYLTIPDSIKPMIIINDKVMKDRSALSSISPNDIDNIEVIKKNIPLLVKEYGPGGKNGIIKIYTKDFVKKHPKQVPKDSVSSYNTNRKNAGQSTNFVTYKPSSQS